MRKTEKAEIHERVMKAAKLLSIEELLERRPKALSGGQRQRVAVGRAIVRDPKAFLFDEPLSNLDAKLRGTMRSELKELHCRLKTTTLYVTHDQEEAMSLGDRIVVMLDGIIRQVGPPMSIYDNPSDRFVAGFVGMPPMNFFDGTMRASGDSVSFETHGQMLTLPDRMVPLVKDYMDKPMVMGVRPEHLTPVEPDQKVDPHSVLNMNVTVSEPLGHCQDVYLHLDDLRVIARCDAHIRVPREGLVSLSVNTKRAHIFETGVLGKNVTMDQKGSR
jgi:multiple sugar transport system ATP-binding protein